MTDQPYMFRDMPDSEREQAEKLVEIMLGHLHRSEMYLSHYIAGRNNAAKACGVIIQTADSIKANIISILQMHDKGK